ncbi:ABC transporter ATP-binding protein [Parapedobacter sp. ISTM3]|uniref:ABC transporter ATP-binding protein n=1 Tax=Parapedobacter TaxID=416949 RepID=UPI0015901CF2|nr:MULTISPECIES: ABC transporter ATP-binding protein [Parapedobacter]MBK1439202.1 ABC transporter ATP-binding protein [Parapedobacter sp. ISTM3]
MDLKSNLQIARTLRLIWSLEGRGMLFVVAMIVVETAFLFSSLYALKGLIDIIAESGGHLGTHVEAVIRQILIAGALTLFYNIARAISFYSSEIQSAKVAEHLNDSIHAKAVELDLSFYESPGYFDKLQRAKEAGDGRPHAVLMALVDTAKNLLSLGAIAYLFIAIDWLLLPIMACFVLPTMMVRIVYSDKLKALRIRNTAIERASNYYSQLITAESSAKEIRSYGLGAYLKQCYFNIRMRLLTERYKLTKQQTTREIATTALASIGFFACMAYMVNKAIHGAVTVGDISIFLVMFPQLFSALQATTNGISTVYQNSIFMDSIFDLLDLKSTFDDPKAARAVPQDDEPLVLKFEQVSFHYPFDSRLVLRNINLMFPQGKIVAIVGANGAGKSTIIKLLNRLYDPVSGRITLQGTDIRKFSSNAYRKQIGVVFQDFCRYHVSVSENIAFGNIDLANHESAAIKQAASQAGAHGFISALPKDYQTVLGRVFEGGSELSIGQWQKLATARALYHPGRFLVLDEATSALDTQSENGLFASLRSFLGTRGAIVVSHRYSTVKQADYAYVLREGEVVEEGIPEELIAKNGYFTALFNTDLIYESSDC